ncbi:hypothetical protein [Bacillus subtilis]|uniref:hypothetical protein n=1 Tax=Bacillus subtilis TaxID=1423 RepID=UPI001BDBA72C|nr:hypothetical protein [Bacillus subtilis]
MKKPKYDHDMEFNAFDFRNEQEFNAYYEEVKDKSVSLGVDLTTLSKILEYGRF